MKKLYVIIVTLMLTIAAMGQSLSVRTGGVTYLFPAEKAGDMIFANGNEVTIMGKTFVLSAIETMTVDQSTVKDNVQWYDGHCRDCR